ncbi:MAG: galactokinase [Polaribacter sp.]|uniref:galactokinase n=1 Tax=Polaribacter sp. TaxID=1920175 RepID=UPI00384CB4D6
MKKKIIKEVKKSFKKHFKTKPLLIFSPGRINLIGEHTDYNDGFVFPAAIDKGIALALQKNEEKNCNIYALNKEEMYSFNLTNITPLIDGGWKNYILGVISEIQKLEIKVGTFNCVFAGDIPGGAGMSSSAALENSVVFGLNELFNLGLSKAQMILISQKAEHNFAGVKCGIMDQYASMFGRKKSALLLDCRTIESTSFKIDFKKYKLLLINSNVKHDLSESAYNDRREVCERVSAILKLKALRDASKEDLDTIKTVISEADYQKALYVIEENSRVLQFSDAIQNNEIETLGNLLYQSHEGLRTKYKVSCKELDFLVAETKENKNIVGARMMGGGFGGCTINLIKKAEVSKFKEEISIKFKKEFHKECTIYQVKLSKGTRVIKE